MSLFDRVDQRVFCAHVREDDDLLLAVIEHRQVRGARWRLREDLRPIDFEDLALSLAGEGFQDLRRFDALAVLDPMLRDAVPGALIRREHLGMSDRR